MQVQMMSRMETLIQESFTNAMPSLSQTMINSANNQESTVEQTSRNPFQYFTWGEKMARIVPQDFRFPNLSAYAMWNLWYHGDRSQKIHPLKLIRKNKHYDDIKKSCKPKLSRAISILDELQRLSRKSDVDISSMSIEESNALFNTAFEQFTINLYGKKQVPVRVSETTCDTLANRFCKSKKSDNYPMIETNP
jgi:hypothetical protein